MEIQDPSSKGRIAVAKVSLV